MDIRSSLNAVDFGLDIGAGAEVTVGPVVPFLEFSYLFGVANISSVAGSTLYNNGFEIKAGIRFRS
jgi:hypothetical protein